MHLFFLCPFAKAAWYSSPWFIKTELLFNDHHTLPDMLNFLLSSNHPNVSIKTLYTFLWCLWKSRSDFLFNKIIIHPKRIFSVASALLQDKALYTQQLSLQTQLGQSQDNQQQRSTLDNQALQEAGHVLFSDAAWSVAPAPLPKQAGLGVFVQLQGHHAASIYISARSPPVSSPIEAEAFGLLLAVKVADCLHLQDPLFKTDSSVLVQASERQDVSSAGPWTIRHIISDIRTSASFDVRKLAHISRNYNFKAHHQAQIALRLQSSTVSARCLSDPSRHCPV